MCIRDRVLTQQDMPEEGMHTIKDLQYYCMTPYDASFQGVHIPVSYTHLDVYKRQKQKRLYPRKRDRGVFIVIPFKE